MTEQNTAESFSFLDVVDAPAIDDTQAGTTGTGTTGTKTKVKKPRAPRKAKTVEPVEHNNANDANDANNDDIVCDVVPKSKPKSRSSKKASKPADIEIDDEAKAEAETKQTLVMTVLRYQESTRFTEYLKKQGLITKAEKLNKMDIAELKEILVRVRFCLGNRGAGNMIDEFVKMGMSGAEALISLKTKYKITGMTEMCFSDEEFLDCYELCKLEYLSFGYIRPELRLMLSTFRIATACHVLNTDERFANINTLNKTDAKGPAKLEKRADNIGGCPIGPVGPSVAGVKKSNSATLGRSSNLVEPDFD